MINGTLEIDIMNAVWQLHDLNEDMNISVKEIVSELSANGVVRAYTTVKTVMDRLTQKGLLVRYKINKKFFYNAVSSKIEMASDSMRQLCNQFFEGNPVSMLRFMEKEIDHLVIRNV